MIALKGSAPIQIGKRTGFAFYPFDGRKILVGVDERQSRLNTYLDGPFDQLPENFIEGEALREAILAADPSVKGKIDRLGNFADGLGRYLIHPYLLYRQAGDLAVFARCVTSKAVRRSRPGGLLRHRRRRGAAEKSTAARPEEALRTHARRGLRLRSWNGPMKASCWARGATARPTPSSR